MTNSTLLFIAFVKGAFVACLFFYILWLSARKLINATWPLSWFIASWLIRMLLVITTFYWIGGGNSLLLVACLCGFIVTKITITKLISVRRPHSQKLASYTNNQP